MAARNQDPGPVSPTLPSFLRKNSKQVRLTWSLGATASYTAMDSVLSFCEGAQFTKRRNVIIAAISIHSGSLSMTYLKVFEFPWKTLNESYLRELLLSGDDTQADC